jgi:hypothetical protein
VNADPGSAAAALAPGGAAPPAAVAEAAALADDAATPGARRREAAGNSALASTTVPESSRPEAYAGQALALLRRARAAGFFKDPANVAHLHQDTDLAPLQLGEDFQKFAAELKAPAKP